MTKASPNIPANSEIAPTTLSKLAPSTAISSSFCISILRSDKNVRKANAALGTVNPLKLESVLIKSTIPFAIFQVPSAAATAPTVVRILPSLVSNSSAHESISSVIPSHSFIFATISSTCVETASLMKSYPGSSKSKPPPPNPSPAPPPEPPLFSSGEITFNSSIPSSAFLTSFAFLAAVPIPSANLSALSAAPPTEELTPL